MAADQNFQGSQNLIFIFPRDCGQTLAGQAQLITEGNPDSFASVVETEYPNLPFPPPPLLRWRQNSSRLTIQHPHWCGRNIQYTFSGCQIDWTLLLKRHEARRPGNRGPC
jgi:hypothetical protein